MFESATRFFFPAFASPLSRMSMSEDETNEHEAHDDDPSELGMDQEQHEEDVEGSVQMMIARRNEIHMEGYEETFEEDGGNHDESAETEPMYQESCSDFDSMWERVQKITEDLHSKRVHFQDLMARLNDHSHLYQIDILVNHGF